MGLLLFLFQYMAAIRWHRPGSDWNLHRRPDLRRCSAAARFRKPAQQVAVTETTMPVLRESRMIGHFAVETQSTKPLKRPCWRARSLPIGGRVGMWRGGVRSTMSVAAPFAADQQIAIRRRFDWVWPKGWSGWLAGKAVHRGV